MPAADLRKTVDAVWRMESAKIVATLTRAVGEVGLAEDLAQDAVLDALRQWPSTGVPGNPGAWLTTVAKRKAVDLWRRQDRLSAHHAALARDLEDHVDEPWDPDGIDDDVLRLIFIATHPVLSRESQLALTLRIVGGLTTEEIASALLTSTATVAARITRAKKSLAGAQVPFEVPDATEYPKRLDAVLSVIYLIYNEGYSASSGHRWIRDELCTEALRLGRTVTALLPQEAEAHGLLALMELQSSRFAARVDADGEPILLEDQDRTKWDRAQIIRGSAALRRCREVLEHKGTGWGHYALQAAIAECHATATSVDDTDWARIVGLYDGLLAITASPVVALNRAVAVAMQSGPAEGLQLVEQISGLQGSYLLPSIRAELLSRMGRNAEAADEFDRASTLAANDQESRVLRAKAAAARSRQ